MTCWSAPRGSTPTPIRTTSRTRTARRRGHQDPDDDTSTDDEQGEKVLLVQDRDAANGDTVTVDDTTVSHVVRELVNASVVSHRSPMRWSISTSGSRRVPRGLTTW
ncbi:hypothetical protein C474_08797 [Halogeometricum pallidum JCM 14848]|uniref:DUF8069 domain-containing protein n=1 Tax=Halogeometricum pallidum JCM 14848 TaxID=1227487 RepID=M0D9J3_HALPD|nr:hypothetical protein C474_08797 [Halogeometricum pallidum JCM 14848]